MGRRGKKTEGKNHVSCTAATFRAFAGKESGRRKQAGFAWKKAALVREEFFIHQLIYGLNT